MNYTQNKKIAQVSKSTMVIGVDIGSEYHYARVFDWRGTELTRKVFRFSNTLDGYHLFEWMGLHTGAFISSEDVCVSMPKCL